MCTWDHTMDFSAILRFINSPSQIFHMSPRSLLHAVQWLHDTPLKVCTVIHLRNSLFMDNQFWGSLLLFSPSVMSASLRPHGLQHIRPPCPSPSPRACSNSCPLSWWCHPTISSSVVLFSSYLQSFPASGSFLMSEFISAGQSIGVLDSASVLPKNIQDWFLLGWTSWISLQSKWLSRVFSNTTV